MKIINLFVSMQLIFIFFERVNEIMSLIDHDHNPIDLHQNF